MKEPKDNKEMYIVGAVTLVMILLILGSFISPFLVYVTMIFLFGMAVTNMVRVGRLTKPVEEPEEPEIPEPTAEEQQIPDVNVVKKDIADATAKIDEYTKKNIAQGATPEEIYHVLVPVYGEELVKSVLVNYIKPEPEPEPKPPEPKPEPKEEQKPKPKKKVVKKVEKKIEIIDPPDIPDETK